MKNQKQFDLGQFDNMDVKQMRMIADFLINKLKDGVKNGVKVGDIIRVNHPKAAGRKFKIVKLNNKKAKCVEMLTNGTEKGNWAIPYSLIIAE